MNRDDRRYPDRPIVGVGAVILVDSHCRIEGIRIPGLHRAASSSSGADSSRSPAIGACRAALWKSVKRSKPEWRARFSKRPDWSWTWVT